jgi:hypothetical protein
LEQSIIAAINFLLVILHHLIRKKNDSFASTPYRFLAKVTKFCCCLSNTHGILTARLIMMAHLVLGPAAAS